MPRVVDVDARRTGLTDAAARLIARSGIEAATMRSVAAEAGWTTGAVTHYFTDKRELLLATFEASLASRSGEHPGSDRTDDAAGDELRALLAKALPIDDDRRRHWLVTLTCCTVAPDDPVLADAQRHAYRRFRRQVTTTVIDDGRVSPDAAVSVAEHLIAVVDGIAVQALFDPDSWPAPRQLEALERALLAIDRAGGLGGHPVDTTT